MRPIWRLCVIASFTFLAQICYAADRNPFIAEISSFKLAIEDISPCLKAVGMTEADIQERVEFACRKNSLPVKSNPLSWLYIRVTALPIRIGGRDTGLTYVIEMNLNQMGNTTVKGISCPIRSWIARTRMGISSSESLRKHIKDDIEEQVEEFANVWLASHEQ